MMTTVTLEYDSGNLSLLLQQIREAIATGVRRIVVDLDSLAGIDTNDVRALIILLRRVRERGRQLALRISKPEVLEYLQGMALDRIFAVVVA